MSVVDIVDRLTGITPIRERIKEHEALLVKMSTWMLNHETRLVRIETLIDPRQPKLPKK